MKKVSFNNTSKKNDGIHPNSESVIFIYKMFKKKKYNIISLFAERSNKKLLISVIHLFNDLKYRYNNEYTKCFELNDYNKYIGLLKTGAGSLIVKIDKYNHLIEDINYIIHKLNKYI